MFGFCVEVTIRMRSGVNSHSSSVARDHNSDVSDPLRKRSATNAVMRVENKSFYSFFDARWNGSLCLVATASCATE